MEFFYVRFAVAGEGEAASAAGEDAQALQPLMSESTARCTAEYRRWLSFSLGDPCTVATST